MVQIISFYFHCNITDRQTNLTDQNLPKQERKETDKLTLRRGKGSHHASFDRHVVKSSRRLFTRCSYASLTYSDIQFTSLHFLSTSTYKVVFSTILIYNNAKTVSVHFTVVVIVFVYRLILEHRYTIRYDTRCYFNVRSKADIG